MEHETSAEGQRAPETAAAGRGAAPVTGGGLRGPSLQALALRLQRTAGNAAVRQLARQGGIFSQMAAGAAHAAAQEELAQFRANGPYKLERHKPSTGAGLFDVEYDPPLLICTVTVHFTFVDGSAAAYPKAKPEQLKWTDAEKSQFSENWSKAVNDFWKPDLFRFYCTRPHWEELQAILVPVLAVVDDATAHFDATVTKIPKGEFEVSSVGLTAVMKPDGSGNQIECRRATFDSEDLTKVDKGGGKQRAAVHESGHMWGLRDEYINEDAGRSAGSETKHSALALKYTGEKSLAKDDDRLMAGGEKVTPVLSITFREALEKASGILAWSLTPPTPADAGIDPSRVDPVTPTPSPDGTALA